MDKYGGLFRKRGLTLFRHTIKQIHLNQTMMMLICQKKLPNFIHRQLWSTNDDSLLIMQTFMTFYGTEIFGYRFHSPIHVIVQYSIGSKTFVLSPSACVRWVTAIVRCVWRRRRRGLGEWGGGSTGGDIFLLRQLREGSSFLGCPVLSGLIIRPFILTCFIY